MRRVIRHGRTTIVQNNGMTQVGEWRDEDEATRMYNLFVSVAVNGSRREEELKEKRS